MSLGDDTDVVLSCCELVECLGLHLSLVQLSLTSQSLLVRYALHSVVLFLLSSMVTYF